MSNSPKKKEARALPDALMGAFAPGGSVYWFVDEPTPGGKGRGKGGEGRGKGVAKGRGGRAGARGSGAGRASRGRGRSDHRQPRRVDAPVVLTPIVARPRRAAAAAGSCSE